MYPIGYISDRCPHRKFQTLKVTNVNSFNFKNLKFFYEKREDFDCAGIRARVIY